MMNFAQFKGAAIEALDMVEDMNPGVTMDQDDWMAQLQIAIENTEDGDEEEFESDEN